MDFACARFKDRFRHLLLADEAYPQCCCSPLAAGKGAKIGSVGVVHYGIRILPANNIDRFYARRPQIAAESKFLLQSQIQARVSGKPKGIRRTDELLLEIDGAEGIPCPVLEEITQLGSPDMRRSPAPAQQPVRGIPGHGSGLLRRIKDGTQRRVQYLVCMRARPRIRA